MRLAAIDIGSNAVRLLINDVTVYKDGSYDYTKVNLIRVPLRLGLEVFDTGQLSENKMQDMVMTMKAFRLLMDVYRIDHYRACATSAMRDATNGPQLVDRIKKEANVHIDIISGSEEAQLLYDTQQHEFLNQNKNYLFIDVGGGSTELVFNVKGKVVAKKSFNIGTIRLLKNIVADEVWDDIKSFTRNNIKLYNDWEAVGSGGNINKIFSLSKTKIDKPLTYELLKEYYKEFERLTVAERIHQYGFKEDRADVIVPALRIYNSVMRWADIKFIWVPQIGLSDGIIHSLHQQHTVNSLVALNRR